MFVSSESFVAKFDLFKTREFVRRSIRFITNEIHILLTEFTLMFIT